MKLRRSFRFVISLALAFMACTGTVEATSLAGSSDVPIVPIASPPGQSPGTANPEDLLTYQGRLTDSSGTPVSTPVSVTFRLYDDEAMPVLIYTSATRILTPTNGLFTVYLGDTTAGDPILNSAVAASAAAVGVTVNSDSEMTPRQPINTLVGHSNANNNEGIVGGSSSGTGVLGNSYSGVGVGASSTSGTGLRATSSSGGAIVAFSQSNVAVSASTNGSDDGVYGSSLSGDGVHGYSAQGNGMTGVSGTSGDGVYGNSVNGAGVQGLSTNGVGVYGVTSGTMSSGVYGKSSSSSTGVWGQSSSGFGVYGQSNSASAIYGQSTSGSGVEGTSQGSAPGIYGHSSSGNGVYGTSSTGAAAVAGTNTNLGGIGVQGEAITGTAVYAKSAGGYVGLNLVNAVDAVATDPDNGGGVYGQGATYGVSGESSIGNGVYGNSPAGNGVFGTSKQAAGVFGSSYYGNGVIAQTVVPTMAGLLAEGSILGPAVEIQSGSLKVDGAGLDTATTAFIHQTSSASICSNGVITVPSQSAINSLLTNGDPNAILIVTPNSGTYTGSPSLFDAPDGVSVFYDAINACHQGTGKWVLYTQHGTPFVINSLYNILVIKR